MQEFKPCEGFNRYVIAPSGEIRHVRTGALIKIQNPSPKRYCVNLTDDRGRLRMRTIANLVARTFVPNPDPSQFKRVYHEDGNLGNYHASNLKWMRSCRESLIKWDDERKKMRSFVPDLVKYLEDNPKAYYCDVAAEFDISLSKLWDLMYHLELKTKKKITKKQKRKIPLRDLI